MIAMGDDTSQTWDFSEVDPVKIMFFIAALCAIYAGVGLYRFVRLVEARSAKGETTSISLASGSLLAMAGALILAGLGYLLRFFVIPILG